MSRLRGVCGVGATVPQTFPRLSDDIAMEALWNRRLGTFDVDLPMSTGTLRCIRDHVVPVGSSTQGMVCG